MSLLLIRGCLESYYNLVSKFYKLIFQKEKKNRQDLILFLT